MRMRVQLSLTSFQDPCLADALVILLHNNPLLVDFSLHFHKDLIETYWCGTI